MSFTGSSGSLAAQADFVLSGSTLTVTLTNTSTSDVLVPTDVLTGVFFNTTHTLTPVSAAVNSGSTVNYGSVVNNVGEGWEYRAGISAQGRNSGISAAGLGIFGPSGNFFAPPVMEDGLDYGILSAGDNLATGNTGVTGHGPLIQDSIVFTLTAGAGFDLSELGSTVVFQYGTATTEPSYFGQQSIPTPVPGTLTLAGIGMASLLAYRRRRTSS
jgi:hypothetical protein